MRFIHHYQSCLIRSIIHSTNNFIELLHNKGKIRLDFCSFTFRFAVKINLKMRISCLTGVHFVSINLIVLIIVTASKGSNFWFLQSFFWYQLFGVFLILFALLGHWERLHFLASLLLSCRLHVWLLPTEMRRSQVSYLPKTSCLILQLPTPLDALCCLWRVAAEEARHQTVKWVISKPLLRQACPILSKQTVFYKNFPNSPIRGLMSHHVNFGVYSLLPVM